MKILHLSDLHLKSEKKEDQDIVYGVFLNHIRDNASEFSDIDFVIFSGDIVYNGGTNVQFDALNSELAKLASVLKIDVDKIFVCPGNHDIDREEVRRNNYVQEGLGQTLTSLSENNKFIDQFVDTPITTPAPPFARLEKFYQKIWSVASPSEIRVSPFFRLHKLDVKGKKVGIACLNTAWRTTGEPGDVDRNRLIMGERCVDIAARELADCDVKLAVFHHPLDWLHPADRLSVEARLFAEFDMMFYGHVHVAKPEVRKNVFGEAVISQGHCLYSSREWHNGFSVIHIDTEASEARFQLLEYLDRRVFRPAERICDNGEFTASFGKASSNGNFNVAAIVRGAAGNINALTKNHINLAGDTAVPMEILSRYAPPPLSRHSEATKHIGEVGFHSQEEVLQVDDLLRAAGDAAIGGGPQHGKTSIAHYLASRCAAGVIDEIRLPVICNFSTIPTAPVSSWKSALWPIIKSYVSEVLAEIKKAQILACPLLVIVDDVDIYDDKRIAMLQRLRNEYPNIRWVFLVRNDMVTISTGKSIRDVIPSVDWVIIRDLSRKQIRLLAAGWLGRDVSDARAVSLFDNIMKHLQRTGLPRTGYIISLLIWVLENRSQGELLNEAVLIQNVLDYMLGRMDYRGALRSEFDFTSKTLLLQEIAFWLKGKSAAASKNELNVFVANFLDERSLKYDCAQIIDGFIACGVLETADGAVGFKFRRFQDFFVAGYIRDDEALRAKLLSDSGLWLDYRREIDIYTSRYRQELQFLNTAFKELGKANLQEVAYTKAQLDDLMNGGPPAHYTARQLRKMKSRTMTAAKIDEMMDRAESKAAMRQRHDEAAGGLRDPKLHTDGAVFSELLRVYSQVIRNLEFIETSDKTTHIRHSVKCWSALIAYWVGNFSSALIEIRNDFVDDETLDTEIRMKIPELIGMIEGTVKTVLASFCSSFAHTSLGSEKLVSLLNEIGRDGSLSKLERFVTFSVVLELDPHCALNMITSWGNYKTLDHWTLSAVSQRLFQYYKSKALSPDFEGAFVNVVAELEVAVNGDKVSKTVIIREIRREQKQAQLKDGR